MDIYTLLAKLRKARRKFTISAGAQGLFMELLAINNEERWSSVFRCPNGELCSALNITEKTLDAHRKQLLAAGLITFRSGKSKRVPCDYSLDGSSIGDTIGSRNGSSIGSKNYHQLGEKTPDLLRDNTKEENKEENLVDEVETRKRKIEDAINDFTEIDLNSNASFNPQHAHLGDEKEKNCAKKEKKVLPAWDDMATRIADTAYWRHVVEHHKQSDAERQALFKLFYEQKEDHYLVRLPSKTDIAQNFYHWVPIHLSKHKIQALNGAAINRSQKHTTGGRNAISGNSATADISSPAGFGKL